MLDLINAISSFISDNILIVVLLAAAVYFTIITRGVQFRLFGEMIRLLLKSGKNDNDSRSRETDGHHTISSFQAFMVSIASRVGTGNLAGVATAIAVGGPALYSGCGSSHFLVRQRLLSSRHLHNYIKYEVKNLLSADRPITLPAACETDHGRYALQC